jgi:hypothetical protein
VKGSKYLRRCIICDSVFSIPILRGNVKSPRQTCSLICHRRFVGKRAKRWTKEEIEILESLSLSMPPKTLYTTYCQLAGRAGYPKRSEAALRAKLKLMGIPLMPEIDWYTLKQLADFFGATRHAMFKMVKIGLKAKKESDYRNQPYFVSRVELKRFARKHPGLFREFKRDGLFVVLEDRALIDLIMEQPIQRQPSRYNPTKVKCVETGNVYPSCRAAARIFFVDPSAIHGAAKKGHRVAGYHWVALR